LTPYQKFFAELKRRQVFKVSAVYGVVAFGLLQVADLLGEGLRLPESFTPFITAVVLLGFPLALVLAWAFELTPDGVRRMDAAAPEEIERILEASALKRWPAGLLALAGFAAMMTGVWFAGKRSGATGADGDASARALPVVERTAGFDYAALADDPRPSIAVLPFADMSPDRDQEYFSDGLTEEILSVLARVRNLRVTARSSAFAFKGRPLDARAVSDSLDVRYLLEGSVRKADRRLRITAELIDGADGSNLWSESYDRELGDIFEIQSEIARAVVAALQLPLGIEDPSRLVSATSDLAAYDLYLAGLGRLRERGTGLIEAIRLFEGAIARDSTWAPAWAGLAQANEFLSWYPFAWPGDEPRESSLREQRFLQYQLTAEAAARRALELRPDIAAAYVALGSVLRNRHEWVSAEAVYLKALDLDPDNAEVHQQYSQFLTSVGRIAEGRRAAERALALDRLPVRLLRLERVFTSDGAIDEALATIEEGIELDRNGQVALLRSDWFAVAVMAGRYREMFRYDTGQVPPEQQAAVTAALEVGDLAGWPRGLEIHPVVWMAVGRPDSAAATLRTWIVDRHYRSVDLIWAPVFDPIRNDPQYLAVLDHLSLHPGAPDRTPRDARTAKDPAS